jgi:hypothetical protein
MDYDPTIGQIVLFGNTYSSADTWTWNSAANATSNVFAGYQATSQSALASASVKFRVPAVQSCNIGDLNLFGSFVDALQGPGEAAVVVYCPPTGPPLYAGLIGGKSTSLVPRPGDLVQTTVTMNTANEATLYDMTQGLSESMSFASLPGPAVAYDGISSADCIFRCGASLVANFGTIWMYGAMLNGVTPRMAGSTAVDMQKGQGLALEVATSALGPRGRAWAEVWENP